MTQFAAHDNFAIYGIGDTPSDAVADALEYTEPVEGHFEVARISDELVAYIRENGWLGGHDCFDIVHGEIRDTTPAHKRIKSVA